MAKTPKRIAQGKQQPKFETNPCIRFRDNCATDGWTDGRTDDGQKSHTKTSADCVSQAELKIKKEFFLQKRQKQLSPISPRGSNNQNLKQNHALGSEITAPQTDGQTDNRPSPPIL